jgi:hypothetical protein
VERNRGLIPLEIAVYQGHHLPIVKAYADKIGVLEVVNQVVSTEREVDPGTMVLSMILDTWSGRSPRYRLTDFFAQHDPALLLGKAIAADACNDDAVGRVLDRLYAVGTMKLFTACAVRADRVCGLDKRSGHCDTTSVSVSGAYRPPEAQQDQQEQQEQGVPVTIPQG